MSTLRTWFCTGVATLTLLGCVPSEADDADQPATPIEAEDAPRAFAEQICTQLFTCECPNSAEYSNHAACVEAQTIEFDSNMAASSGTWNAQCAGELAKVWSQWACLGPVMAGREASFNARMCPIVKGSRSVGADCSLWSIGDDCQEGLACIDNICVEAPPLPVPVGGVCRYTWDNLPCETGSDCDYDPTSDSYRCKALPEAGDACTAQDYLCGPTNTLLCNWETLVCDPTPAADEPCFEQYLCSPSNYCDGGKDFTCQPRGEIGDGCSADAVCPTDAWCVGNICEARPAAVCQLQYWF